MQGVKGVGQSKAGKAKHEGRTHTLWQSAGRRAKAYRGESSQSSGSLSAIFPEGPTGCSFSCFVEASPVAS